MDHTGQFRPVTDKQVAAGRSNVIMNLLILVYNVDFYNLIRYFTIK